MSTNGNGSRPDGFELRAVGGASYLACTAFEAEGFVAAFSTREGAAEGESTADTARRLLGALGRADSTVVTCRQVHGAAVRVVGAGAAGEPDCDALVTAEEGVLLGIKTADCVPVLIADRKTNAVAAVHAGWRGTANRVLERAFATMVGKYSTRRGDCIAAVGPAICGPCYEVGPEVLAKFRDEFPYAARFVTGGDGEGGKGHVDLKAANAIQLEMCGIAPEDIYVTDRCTLCDNERFYSYRGEGARAGRILSVVGTA